MEHPLIEINPELGIDELQSKINELTKKLGIAYRSGNGQLMSQLQMAVDSYRSRYQQKLQEMQDTARQNGNDYSDRIKVS